MGTVPVSATSSSFKSAGFACNALPIVLPSSCSLPSCASALSRAEGCLSRGCWVLVGPCLCFCLQSCVQPARGTS